MSDMAATIEELRTAAAAINDAANWLAEMFSGAGDSWLWFRVQGC